MTVVVGFCAFRRCWPQWRCRLQSLSKSFGLPRGAMERLSLNLLVNSQLAVGCLELLQRCRPAAVVTDYDRAGLASSLVLAARSLGIPTFTLQHGVMGDDAVGYVPVHRGPDVLLGRNASADHDRGRPGSGEVGDWRMSAIDARIAGDPATVRSRLNIDPSHRVVMLGTSPVPPVAAEASGSMVL